MPYKLLQKKYTEYDLFVIPSPYENFPNTALEAINYGVTVVGSKSSGVADMIGRIYPITASCLIQFLILKE